MHRSCLLLAFVALLSGGCSAVMFRSGRDLSVLTKHEDVRLALGTPKEVGRVDETDDIMSAKGGVFYEEYRTRCKVSEPSLAMACTQGDAMLFLLPEPLYLLMAITDTARSLTVGQNVRFTFNEQGYVVGYGVVREP